MALSGDLTIGYTAAELITRSLKKIGVTPQGGSVSGDEMADGLDTLSEMFATWSTEGPNLWTAAEQTVTLVTATQDYTLSPRPRLVKNARFVEDGTETRPLAEWTKQQWDLFPYKASTGLPTIFMVNKQRTATTMSFWPLPTFSSGTYTVKVGYERVWEVVTDGAQDLDIAEEFMETAVICLAARLIEDYQLPEDDNTARIRARATTLYNQSMGFDRGGSIQFVRG